MLSQHLRSCQASKPQNAPAHSAGPVPQMRPDDLWASTFKHFQISGPLFLNKNKIRLPKKRPKIQNKNRNVFNLKLDRCWKPFWYPTRNSEATTQTRSPFNIQRTRMFLYQELMQTQNNNKSINESDQIAKQRPQINQKCTINQHQFNRNLHEDINMAKGKNKLDVLMMAGPAKNL